MSDKGLFIIKDYDYGNIMAVILVDTKHLKKCSDLMFKCDSRTERSKYYYEDYRGFFLELEKHNIDFEILHDFEEYNF